MAINATRGYRPGLVDLRLGEISRQELAEVVQDAWLSRASPRRAERWLAEHG